MALLELLGKVCFCLFEVVTIIKGIISTIRLIGLIRVVRFTRVM